ncbi:type IV pilus biogenesis complex membrane subunit [Natronomonas pharaonis DSM 2160]|uniref:Type IV pilus biogenesis complex membrane subunit n=1 Tax=Natronomonas pharaonis (strain ATCC 35678 / DSM 2160 / CIP 103997 / JCM 8858 / NBRC 14720 / NCIMB 2260 / Gabara) TaxID=348780 RepID=Q3IQF1_NATPD|nr:type II secretion system F family protein [Natronomonas pharaonis]CAI49645.1 type IV pilus biogenesis complex membrane subunit [Natronomonas pharaonis DSM 2160]
MFRFLPLVAAVGVTAVLVAAPFIGRIDTMVSRLAFRLFDGRSISAPPQRTKLLRGAAIGTPYREYATKTYFYIVFAAAVGAVFGVYAGAGVFALVETYGPGVPTVLPTVFGLDGTRLALLLLTSGLVGSLAAGGAYAARWRLPSIRADARQRQIDASLPRMVAFTYALTRGGMSFPDVLRTLSQNEDVFGEGAAEIGVVVRRMDLFNVDLVTAVQDISQQTPSEQFAQFSENLVSVLQSGQNVSTFLREQYERYRDEAEEQQKEILELLATAAEVYVTVIVAGMLFLVTILLIIGLTVGETLFIMQAIAYVIIPAANLLILSYLLEITQPLRTGGEARQLLGVGGAATPQEVVDTSSEYHHPQSAENHERLDAYRRIQSIQETLASPVQSLVTRPTLLLYVTVPIALVVTAYRLPGAIAGGSIDIEVLDDILIQAAIFLMGTFAVVYEVSKYRLRRLEQAVPDFLDRLASLNEAGISVVSSLDRVRDSDVGALDDEVNRIWRDIEWGATVEQSLNRFESRVKTPSVTRVVTLITNSMRASNEIGPVLRIAAEQARSDLRLRRQRRQEMLTYLVVIYVSFLVFLIVILALDYVLIPSLPDAEALAGPEGAPAMLGGFEGGDEEAYQLIFFHTAVIQSTLSGVVGGVMGGGSIKDGMKHSTAMLTITYVLLTLL